MTIHFNKKSMMPRRRDLRNNCTFAEYRLWKQLQHSRMLGYKFRRQYSVDEYVIDFYCTELKFAIEIDGSVHETDDAREYDANRQQYIEQFGVRFLRVTNDEVIYFMSKVLEKIRGRIRDLNTTQ